MIIAIKTFYTNRIVEGSQKAIIYKNILTVVHINTVGVVSPAADYLDVSYLHVATAHRTNIVDQGVTHSDAVDKHPRAVFKLNGMPSFRIAHRLSIAYRVFLKEYLLLVMTVIKNTAAENTDILRIYGMYRRVYHRALVDKYGVTVLKLQDAHLVRTLAEVIDTCLFFGDLKVGYGIGKDMERSTSSKRLYRKIRGLRESEADDSVLDCGLYTERIGTYPYVTFGESILRYNLKISSPVGLEG